MNEIPFYAALARTLDAYARCKVTGNTEWEEKHLARAEEMVREHCPSGSGFDRGTTLDVERTMARMKVKPEGSIVLNTSFRHMDEHGSYDGWTEHGIIVTPSLAYGFGLRVTGRDRNEIKDYIAEVFHEALSGAVPCH